MARSVLSVSAGLAVIAIILASLWIGFGPRPQGGPDKRAAVIPLSQQPHSTVDARGQAIRTIVPGSSSAPGMAASAPPAAAPPAAPIAPTGQPESPSATALRTDTAPDAARDSSAPSGEGVDLNAASVEQLNGLGAGMIGKRIVEFRPYAAPDELLTRRVLKRADYDLIKNAITVRPPGGQRAQ